MDDLITHLRSIRQQGFKTGIGETCEKAADKIEGLQADLESAVETAFNRGAAEWTRLNYPDLYARFNRKH